MENGVLPLITICRHTSQRNGRHSAGAHYVMRIDDTGQPLNSYGRTTCVHWQIVNHAGPDQPATVTPTTHIPG